MSISQFTWAGMLYVHERSLPAYDAPAPFGAEGHRGQVGELGSLEVCLGYFHIELGVAQVGVVLKCEVYEACELRVGEDLLPQQVSEGGGVYGLSAGLGVLFGEYCRGGSLVLFVYSAASHDAYGKYCDAHTGYIDEFHSLNIIT